MKQRGFGGILLVLAMVVAIALLLGAGTMEKNEYTKTSILSETKIKLSNFEVNLKRAAMDCPKTVPLLSTCIDTNANTLLPLIFNNEHSCNKTATAAIDANNAYFDLTCNITAETGKPQIKGTFSKRISVKRE